MWAPRGHQPFFQTLANFYMLCIDLPFIIIIIIIIRALKLEFTLLIIL